MHRHRTLRFCERGSQLDFTSKNLILNRSAEPHSFPENRSCQQNWQESMHWAAHAKGAAHKITAGHNRRTTGSSFLEIGAVRRAMSQMPDLYQRGSCVGYRLLFSSRTTYPCLTADRNLPSGHDGRRMRPIATAAGFGFPSKSMMAVFAVQGKESWPIQMMRPPQAGKRDFAAESARARESD